ncbi:MAG: PorV/PorQ family protein [Candidatus Delongbacteria bacterium]|nr:PorV/PorQ family protein [Candidatus Delongbacteria bacterium]
MRRYAIILMWLFLTLPMAAGGITKVGTTSANFMKIGLSSRIESMGGAYAGLGDDIASLQLNPAGMARCQSQAMFTYVDWLAETQFNYFGLLMNLNQFGSIGLGISTFSSGDMAVRTTSQPEGTGEMFSTSSFAVSLSYGRNLTDRFAIGGTAKYIHERVWHMNTGTMAFDIGTLFTTPFWGVQLGAYVANFGSNLKLSGRDSKFGYDPDQENEGTAELVNAEYELESHPLPLQFRVGIGKRMDMGAFSQLTAAIDAVHPNDNTEYINTGLEYGFKKMVFLRVGYKNMFEKDGEQGLTFGAGLNYRFGQSWMVVDYAYSEFNRLDYAQRISLGIKF